MSNLAIPQSPSALSRPAKGLNTNPLQMFPQSLADSLAYLSLHLPPSVHPPQLFRADPEARLHLLPLSHSGASGWRGSGSESGTQRESHIVSQLQTPSPGRDELCWRRNNMGQCSLFTCRAIMPPCQHPQATVLRRHWWSVP